MRRYYVQDSRGRRVPLDVALEDLGIKTSVWFVPEGYECPACGEADMDKLAIDNDGVVVTCEACGCVYAIE